MGIQSIGEILGASLDPHQGSAKPRTQKTDFADMYGKRITSAEAEEMGLRSNCGPAPEPVTCEFCGKTLYYEGWVTPGTVTGYGEKRFPHIFRWSSHPQRCTCPSATKKWAEYDAEIERKEMEEKKAREIAMHRDRVDRLLENSGIKKRFLMRTFEQFRTDTPGRLKAYKAARNYAESFEAKLKTGEGLYIEGTNGTGKTHLAAAIALYLIEKEYSVIMRTSFDLLDEIKRRFGDAERSEYQILEDYKKCDLLIIDDLGKELCTDWSMSILYSIINDRYEQMKPIIITTNFGADDLIRALTPKGQGSHTIEAIISRLREVSKTLTMAWEDCR